MLIRVWVSWLRSRTERIYGRSESEGNLDCQHNITVALRMPWPKSGACRSWKGGLTLAVGRVLPIELAGAIKPHSIGMSLP